MRPRVLAAVVGLATAVAVAGCGLGPSGGSSAVDLRITQDFGTHTVTTLTGAGRAADGLSLLEHHARVRAGGPGTGASAGADTGSDSGVLAVDGRARPGRWMYWVNGIQPKRIAAATQVYAGDHVWWDLHATRATESVPAVVGSFPEPFLHGIEGRRYPSTIECGHGRGVACRAIMAQFTRFHIPLSEAGSGYGSGTDSLSVDVGTWEQLATEVVGGLIGKGPRASGVYARFADGGHRLTLLDAAGRVVQTLGPDSGLIAATAGPSDVPTWVVTGTDPAGVVAAARALTPAALVGHLALAVHGAARYAVPRPSSR